MLVLESKDGDGRIYVFPLGEAPAVVTIGRAKDNDIVLADPTVSRHHAVIILKSESIEVEDLESANGTWADQEKVTERKVLKSGSAIKIGNLHFILKEASPEKGV